MQNGKVYELQMQERLTSDSESSLLPTLKARDSQAEGYEAGLRRASPQVGTILKGLVERDERVTLLRSPKASEGQGGALGEAEARKRGNTVGVRDQVMDLVASQGHKVSRTEVNLPTPTVSDIFTGNLSSKQHSEGSLHSVSLAQIVHRADLLPTPIVRDYKDGQSEVLRDGKVQTDTVGRAVMNSGEIHGMSWGKFEPAIRRWEAILGRQAPSPTKADGKEGAHRLSSSFTEWMMGLPENWICGHDLKRNDELKLAGNGVVPQQAELALRLLLNSDEE
jgi:DNA (cytosine-5)-methyltransferase 1